MDESGKCWAPSSKRKRVDDPQGINHLINHILSQFYGNKYLYLETDGTDHGIQGARSANYGDDVETFV
jgi:hypothetical protein